MKDERLIITGCLIIVLAYAGFITAQNKRKDTTILHAAVVIKAQKSEVRALEKNCNNKSVVNLILRDKISGREERELQRDERYMELVTKID